MARVFSTITYLIIWGSTICACSENDSDKEKDVTLTIYEETGFGAPLLSDYLTEPLRFSDSDKQSQELLMDILIEGLEFEYNRGYRYMFKAKKIWMSNPPQDVSNIKYRIKELLSKEKMVKSDSEEELTLIVASETVKFLPRYRSDIENRIYDALSVRVAGVETPIAIIEVEGFNHEPGYKCTIRVKKYTQANPYHVRYSLLEVISKEKLTS
ncbi:MAG: DUF4377 domain-containing protein [Bacteroidales bacterium]